MTDDVTQKNKKGIVKRLMFGNEDKPDVTPEQLKLSKWEAFKFLLFGRFGTMVTLNLLTLVFALPMIVFMLMFYLNKIVAAGYIPYSSNIGIGYPVVTNAEQLGVLVDFTYTLTEYSILVPCIAILAVGMSGSLYVIRKLIWDQPVRVVKDFFIGIAKSWTQSFFVGLAFGMALLFAVFSLGYFDAYGHPVTLKAVSVTLAMILLVFMIIFTSFFMTQNAAFKMRVSVLIRNSVLFVFGAFLQSMIFIGIALIPVYFMFLPDMTMLLTIVYVFIGFSYTELVVTLFCHTCYEKFLYDKVTGAPPTAYGKREHDAEEYDAKANKKKAQTNYKNPKKRKKSIDEGASITPLVPMFKREDLERLQREHERVAADSDVDGEREDNSAAGDGKQ